MSMPNPTDVANPSDATGFFPGARAVAERLVRIHTGDPDRWLKDLLPAERRRYVDAAIVALRLLQPEVHQRALYSSSQGHRS